MKNKDILIQQILFGFNQLSPDNGQMNFEHICRHVTLTKICSNVLPATGPVQAGGDQGRDFETFHTYLKNSGIADNSFIGLASEKPIAFACSLEKKPATPKGKIFKDVTTIMKSGVLPDRIYFFSGEPIPVAKRHQIQEIIKSKFDVTLEVIDVKAIAELLSDSDTFWIANKYLNVPSEIFPRPENGDSWYESLLEEYKTEEAFSLSFEVFQDFKNALRFIYKDENLKQDLPFWLDKMNAFVAEEKDSLLKRDAIYERFVAAFIGLRFYMGHEEDIRFYFADLEKLTEISDLTDATCLLSFLSADAEHKIDFTFDKSEVKRWRNILIKATDECIDNSFTANDFCSFAEIKRQQMMNGVRKQFTEVSQYKEALEESLLLLTQIIERLPEAPFFPVEELSMQLNAQIETLLKINIVSVDLEDLAQKIDDILSKRIGNIHAAEKLRDRAILYLDTNNELMALKALHKSKIKWFQKETMYGLILTCLLLSESYKRLKMLYAAKFYAMAACHFSTRDRDKELMPNLSKGIRQLANIEYKFGNWISFLDLTDTLIPLLSAFKKEQVFTEETQYTEIVYYSGLIRYFGNRYIPELSDTIDSKMVRWGWLKDDVLKSTKLVSKKYDVLSDEEVFKIFQEKMSYSPFSDLGKTVVVKFSVFGVNWIFEYENNYQTVVLAEQLIAYLQIFFVELALEDLHLLKSDVKIKVSKVNFGSPGFESIPSNKENLWKISLPTAESDELDYALKLTSKYCEFALKVLLRQSLLPHEAFSKILEKVVKKEELITKTFFGKIYEHYYESYFDKSKFNSSKRHLFSSPLSEQDFNTESHSLLEWNQNISKFYNKSQQLKSIRERYIKGAENLNVSLPLLVKNPNFIATIETLRKEGYLDWQLLMSLNNAVISYKLEKQGLSLASGDKVVFTEFRRIGALPEAATYVPLPSYLYSIEHFRHFLNVTLVAVIRSYGLEVHTKTLSPIDIRNLLSSKCAFDKLDIKGLSPFNF
jgi:hypothetical protein